MSYTASGRTVIKLGTVAQENVEAQIYENASTYDIEPAAITTYADTSVAFPYVV